MTSLRRIVLVLLSAAALAGCSSSEASPVDASSVDATGSNDGGESPLDAGETADAGETNDGGSGPDGAVTDSGPGSTGLYTGAYVMDACGPADGPAIAITRYGALTAACSADPEQPSLSFFIHDLGGATIPPSSGDTLTSTPSMIHGAATECPGGRPPCRVSQTWTITFDTYVADGPASGQYSITWDDASTSSGAFDAARCPSSGGRCG